MTRVPSAKMPEIAGNRMPENSHSALRPPPKSGKPPERKGSSAKDSAGILPESKRKAADCRNRPRKPPANAQTGTEPSQANETSEEVERRYARNLLQPEAQAGIVVGAAYSDPRSQGQLPFDVMAVRDELKVINEQVARGDMSHPERTAMAQVKSLDWLFSCLTALAFSNVERPEFEKLMRLAFRAQSQCARTLETLASLKNPAIFTKQLNVANQQVVNNGPVLPSQNQSSPDALPEAASLVRLADSELSSHAHERMD